MKTPMFRPAEVIIVAVGVLLLLSLWVGFGTLREFQQQHDEANDSRLINRAVSCDIIKGLGLTEPDYCADPDLLEFRDPDVIRGSTISSRTSQETQELICLLAKQQSQPVPPSLCQTE